MKIIIDTHTHSIASGHAYSTIQEMAKAASENGIKMFAITDHGPGMKGGPHIYYFGNLRVIPSVLYGTRIIKGAEVNILDSDGNIDITEEYLLKLEFVIASLHEICIAPSTKEKNTEALVNALKNPHIDALAHAGNPQYPVDIDKVVQTAKDYDKMIEINNSSFTIRSGSMENCRQFALKCMEYGVKVVCGSDAHISFDIGKFDAVYRLFKEIDMPEELVLNTSVKKFEEYLILRKMRINQ